MATEKDDKREEVLNWFIWAVRILYLPVVFTRLISCVVLKVWQRRYHDVRTLLGHRPLKTQSQLQTMENVQGTSPLTDLSACSFMSSLWVLLRIHFGICVKINFQKHILLFKSTYPLCVDRSEPKFFSYLKRKQNYCHVLPDILGGNNWTTPHTNTHAVA